jgi:type IV secretion system protein TrbL
MCNLLDPLTYKSCVSQVGKSVAGDAFNSIAQSFGQAGDHAVTWLWTQMNSATAVSLGGKGFDLELEITAAIAGVVALGLFIIQIIQSVLRREPGGLGRALKGLLIAFIGGAVAITVVNLLLGATDSLCTGVVKVATGTNISGLGKLILANGALTSALTGSAALLLLSLACIVATVIVYFALVVRKLLIVVTAVFAPIAFAGSLADITASWTRRWIETTVALIASKLILILIFVAGYGILIHGAGESGTGTTQKVTQVISGILVLFVAGFAPWMALKIVHFTGEHAHQLHSLGSSAVGGVSAGGRMAHKAAPYVARAAPMAAGVAGAGAAAGAGTVGATGAGAGSGAGASRGGRVGPSDGSPGGARGTPGTPAGSGGRDGSLSGTRPGGLQGAMPHAGGSGSPASSTAGRQAPDARPATGAPAPSSGAGPRPPATAVPAALPSWSTMQSTKPSAPGSQP